MQLTKKEYVGIYAFSQYRKRLVSYIIVIISVTIVVNYITDQYVPYHLQSRYCFDSGFKYQGQPAESTLAIYFPNCLRHKGKFKVENTTGYNICVATEQYGFTILGQGEYSLAVKPLVFFIMQPQENKISEYEGVLSLKEERGYGIEYSIAGNGIEITDISYKLHIF